MTRELVLSSLPCEQTVKRWLVYEPGIQSSPGAELASMLILNFSVSRIAINKGLCLAAPFLIIHYGSLSLLRLHGSSLFGILGGS